MDHRLAATRLHSLRAGEALRAAEILDCELRFLVDNGSCARIEDIKNYQLVGLLDGIVRELKPAVVFTHNASEFHRDHVTVHNACVSTQRLLPFDFFTRAPTSTSRMNGRMVGVQYAEGLDVSRMLLV